MSLEELIFKHSRRLSKIKRSLFDSENISKYRNMYNKRFMWFRLGYSSNYNGIVSIYYSGWLDY